MPPRLSALDASFLRIEGPSAHMHVAWVARFEPRADGTCADAEEVRSLVAGRLHLVPRLRQRLAEPLARTGAPYWVDDEDFDLAAHVTDHGSWLRFLGSAGWGTLVDEMLGEPLDRARPLWHMAVVPHLGEGGLGVVCRMHHAMVDGISALEVGMLLLDAAPTRKVDPPAPWQPRRAPARAELTARALAVESAAPLRLAAEAARRARRPRSAAVGLRRAVQSSLSALREDVLPAAPPSALNGDTGSKRTLVTHRLDLDAVRDAGRFHRATVNDVCLGLVAGALRKVLPPVAGPGVKAMIPVSTLAAGASGPGNHISFCAVHLPIGDPDPVSRLVRIVHATRAFKSSARAEGTSNLLRALDLVPAPARGLVADASASPRAWNLAISNVPGPEEPVYLLGHRLADAYPVVPLARRHALAVGIFSYHGSVHVGLHAEPDAFGEVLAMPRELDAELGALLEPATRSQRFRRGGPVRPVVVPGLPVGAGRADG